MSKHEYEDNPAMDHEVYSSEEEGVAFLGEFCPAFANATTTLHSITPPPPGLSLSANSATPLPTLRSATPSFMAIPKATPLPTVSTLLPIFTTTPPHLTTTLKPRDLRVIQRSKIRTTTTTPPPYLLTPPQLCFANPDVQLKKKNKRMKFDTPPPSCESKLSFHCTTATTPPPLLFTTPTTEPLLELPINVPRLTQQQKRSRNNENRRQNNKRKRLGFVPKPISRSKPKSSKKIRCSKTVPIGSSSSFPQNSLDLDRDLDQLGTLLDDLDFNDLDFDDQAQFDDILGSGGGERVENDLQSMHVDSLFQPSSSTTTEDADPDNGSYILYEENLDVSQQPETLQCTTCSNSISSPSCPIHKIRGNRILAHPPEPDLYWQSKWNFDYFHDCNYFENKEIATEMDFADSFIYYEVTKLFTEDLINRCLS